MNTWRKFDDMTRYEGRILAWFPSDASAYFIVWGYNGETDGWLLDDRESAISEYGIPSHWMTMPDPPEVKP